MKQTTKAKIILIIIFITIIQIDFAHSGIIRLISLIALPFEMLILGMIYEKE